MSEPLTEPVDAIKLTDTLRDVISQVERLNLEKHWLEEEIEKLRRSSLSKRMDELDQQVEFLKKDRNEWRSNAEAMNQKLIDARTTNEKLNRRVQQAEATNASLRPATPHGVECIRRERDRLKQENVELREMFEAEMRAASVLKNENDQLRTTYDSLKSLKHLNRLRERAKELQPYFFDPKKPIVRQHRGDVYLAHHVGADIKIQLPPCIGDVVGRLLDLADPDYEDKCAERSAMGEAAPPIVERSVDHEDALDALTYMLGSQKFENEFHEWWEKNSRGYSSATDIRDLVKAAAYFGLDSTKKAVVK